jgi:hypothetical protein
MRSFVMSAEGVSSGGNIRLSNENLNSVPSEINVICCRYSVSAFVIISFHCTDLAPGVTLCYPHMGYHSLNEFRFEN